MKLTRARYSPPILFIITASISVLAGIVVCWNGARASDQPLRSDAIIHHLTAVISWYRDSQSRTQSAGLASDAIYQGDAQNLATQAVHLAFESAKAEVPLVGTEQRPGPNEQAPHSSGQGPNFSQMQARTSAHLSDLRSQLDAVNKQLLTAPRGAAKKALLARRDKLQGGIAVNSAILDSVGKMVNFIESGSENNSDGLEGSIDQLVHSVPEAFGSAGGQKRESKPAVESPGQAAASNSRGLLGQAMSLYSQMRSVRDIDRLAGETQTVRDTAEALRKPLRDAMKTTVQQSAELENQTEPAGSASLGSEDVKQQFDALAAKFKLLSAALIPLSQEIIVLDQSHANLLDWRNSVTRQSGYALRALLLHVGTIALALGLLLVLSEVWRRFTFRYVHDARRRRQFLTMRRFVLGFLMGIVIILGFVSEFSSLATFAGFVTAGIAVGLQAVLLSIAAYFFLIGRYGIRVGERVSVAGVTGDVIDIGLVRLYLMELAPSGVDFYPTGRIVVFSNSIFFQAGTPFYKQIPGTEYTWHEVAVTLAPTSDSRAVQEKLLSAVNSVYETYRADIERQHNEIERRIEIFMKAPNPESQLRFTDSGLEFRVRYPVDIHKASAIDDEVTRRVLDVVNAEQSTKAAVSGPPKIRAAARA